MFRKSLSRYLRLYCWEIQIPHGFLITTTCSSQSRDQGVTMRMIHCTHPGLYIVIVSCEHHKKPLKLYYFCFTHEGVMAKGSQRTGPDSQLILGRAVWNIIKMIFYGSVQFWTIYIQLEVVELEVVEGLLCVRSSKCFVYIMSFNLPNNV